MQNNAVNDDPSVVATPENVDISQGVPIPKGQPGDSSAQQAAGGPVGQTEGKNQLEGQKPSQQADKTSDEVNNRLKQMIARQNKLLATIGINPDSDLAEQLEDVSAEERCRDGNQEPEESRVKHGGGKVFPGDLKESDNGRYHQDK